MPPPPYAGFLGAAETITDDMWNAMDPWLRILAQDANGEGTYNNERALIGHLEAKYHMVLDTATDNLFSPANEIKVDLTVLGKKNGVSKFLAQDPTAVDHRNNYPYIAIHSGDEDARKLTLMRLTALNFAALRQAGLEAPTAFFMAALRARWVVTGCYSVTKQDTAATYNEVTVVRNNDANLGPIVVAASARDILAALGKYATEFNTEYSSDKHGMRFVTSHAENIWAAVEYVFRVRNHHFKDQREFVDGYTSLYERFLVACYEGQFVWPENIKMYDVFRLAIHPFKLKALAVMTAHFIAHGKVANAGITRMSGSPCGCAAITTTVAALDTMRAEAWWPAFNRAYGEAIKLSAELADQINDNKYGYHISAGLYGIARTNILKASGSDISLEEGKSRVSVIASACQGMINALKEAVTAKMITKFALQNARALEKPAAANPLLALRISTLVSASLNAVSSADGIKDAIAGALPALEADESKSTAVTVVN